MICERGGVVVDERGAQRQSKGVEFQTACAIDEDARPEIVRRYVSEDAGGLYDKTSDLLLTQWLTGTSEL